MVVKDPIILKCQPKTYPIEHQEALEKLILLPAQIKNADGTYSPNPAIIGGFSEDGVKAIERNQGRLFKWGKTNEKYLQDINDSTEDVEVDP